MLRRISTGAGKALFGAWTVICAVLTILSLPAVPDDVAKWGCVVAWVDASPTRWLLPAFGWVGLFGAFSVLYLRTRGPSQPRPEPLPKSPSLAQPSDPTLGEEQRDTSEAAPDDRAIVDVTPQYLTSFFDDHMVVQAQKLAEDYVGKWMRVSGPLGNVYPYRQTSGYAQVTFVHNTFPHPDDEPPHVRSTTVYMYCPDEETVDRLALLERGTRITVVGRIREVEFLTVHLEECDLVYVEPERDQAGEEGQP